MAAYCEVCYERKSKYKCPKCLMAYCSCACFKHHLERVCGLVVNRSQLKQSSVAVKRRTPPPPDCDSKDIVAPEKLSLLATDERLKACLSNPHLRSLLSRLDQSEQPAEDVVRAMTEPVFVQFVDHCMRIVEPSDVEAS